MPTSSNIDGRTIAEAFLRRIEIGSGDRAYLSKENGTWKNTYWKEVYEQVLGLYHAFQKDNLQKGDRICILSQSNAQWNMTDLANLCSGIITVPIYHSSLPVDIAYLLNHCDAKLLFVEDEIQHKKAIEAFKINGKSIPVIGFKSLVPPTEGNAAKLLSEFAPPIRNKTIEDAFKKSAMDIKDEDIASIVYTSGTTGKPKGAVLTHKNFTSELRSIIQLFDIGNEDITLTFLPFAHILGRVESFMPLFSGINLAFAENINSIPQNIQEIKPTCLVSVPRIYEKIYNKIQSEVSNQPEIKQKIFKWAQATGRQVARLQSNNEPVPILLSIEYKIADQLVFSKIRKKMGGRIRVGVSGGAPLAAELCEFFYAAGIKVAEGYGLTETTGAITVNQLDAHRFGTVGKPLGDTEIRIAEDGEILLKGSMVFKGYYNNPEETKEVFSEGWFRSGDIGEFTNGGFLKITDRKKELIVTSGGKNIAPQKIENMLKGIPIVSQAIVFGDKQKYIAALVTLNELDAFKWAKENQISYDSFADLSKNQKLHDLVDVAVREVNAGLPSFESVKKFRILPKDLTIEDGELTPSMKVKRKVCAIKFKEYVDSLF